MSAPITDHDEMLAIWNQTIVNLEKVIKPETFSNWILPLKFKNYSENTLVLSVPTQFFKEWVEDFYLECIINAVSTAAGRHISIKLVIA